MKGMGYAHRGPLGVQRSMSLNKNKFGLYHNSKIELVYWETQVTYGGYYGINEIYRGSCTCMCKNALGFTSCIINTYTCRTMVYLTLIGGDLNSFLDVKHFMK